MSSDIPHQPLPKHTPRSTEQLPEWMNEWDWVGDQPRSASALGRIQNSSHVTIPLDDARSSFSSPSLTTLGDLESQHPQTEESISEQPSRAPSFDLTVTSPSAIPPQALQGTSAVAPAAVSEPPLVPPVPTSGTAPEPALPVPAVAAVVKPRTTAGLILDFFAALGSLIFVVAVLGGLVCLFIWSMGLWPGQKF